MTFCDNIQTMEKRHRVFVAINLPEEIKKEVVFVFGKIFRITGQVDRQR